MDWCDLGLSRSPPPLADLIASRGGQVVRRTSTAPVCSPWRRGVAVDTSMAVLLTRIGLLAVGLADWICGFMSAVGSSNPYDVTRLFFDLWPHGCCRVLVGAKADASDDGHRPASRSANPKPASDRRCSFALWQHRNAKLGRLSHASAGLTLGLRWQRRGCRRRCRGPRRGRSRSPSPSRRRSRSGCSGHPRRCVLARPVSLQLSFGAKCCKPPNRRAESNSTLIATGAGGRCLRPCRESTRRAQSRRASGRRRRWRASSAAPPRRVAGPDKRARQKTSQVAARK